MADYEGIENVCQAISEATDRLEYNSATDTYWLQHDWCSDREVCTTIALAVAAVTDTPPTNFEPVYTVINSDALQQLFRITDERTSRECSARVTFTINDCDVTVYASGKIELAPLGVA